MSLTRIVANVLADVPGASKITETYRAATPRSAERYARAVRHEPGGVSRQVSHWNPYPLTMTHGVGPFLYDVDGRRYFDLLGNFTSLVHGNAYPPIEAAVRAALPRGLAWSANNEAQASLAAQIAARVPDAEQIRFTNSGTEAANLALLIARAVTGRHKVLMARFGYHGSLHEFEVGSFDSTGPATILAEYGNVDSFRAALDAHGKDIAAVFVEGVLGARGMRPAPAQFFIELKRAANAAGALLVIDEVISFRLGYGGQKGNLGVTADLTMFGKLIGGGLPVGAVGGPRDLLKVFDPGALKVWHSGTFNANPLTMAAGDVAVRELTAERIATMNRLGARLRAGLESAAAKLGLPFHVNHAGSLLNIFFSRTAPDRITDRSDFATISRFHLACLNHGLFIAARGMFVISTVMTEAQVDEVIERASLAMADVARELP